MKHSLLALFLVVSAAPLFANDQDGEIAFIPSYRELVREGYGPREQPFRPVVSVAPKPTQAFYGQGYIVYYGYTAMPVRAGDGNTLYAFGSPVEYFRRMMPASDTDTNLNRYAVAVSNGNYNYGNAVAQGRDRRAEATTVVKSTTVATPPVAAAKPAPAGGAAVGEKSTH